MKISQANRDLVRRLAGGEALDASEVNDSLSSTLQQMGLELQSQGGCYQLTRQLELLNAKAIKSHLNEDVQSSLEDVIIHWGIDSTNDFLLRRMARENSHGVICLAEQQTAGKGRRGRSWVSPFGCNLYMSLGWTLPRSGSGVAALSLVVGMELTRLLRDMGVSDVGLKWPNDLLSSKGKLAGILIEVIPLGSKWGIVIGVGVNFEAGLEYLSHIDQRVGMVPASSRISRNQLAGKLINVLIPVLTDYHEKGFAPHQADWSRYNIYQDSRVCILQGDDSLEGVDRGVDQDGNLILECEGVRRIFSSGEVSLRPFGNDEQS